MSAAPVTLRGVRFLLSSGAYDGPVTLDSGRLWMHETPHATVVDLARHDLVARAGLVNGHDHLDFGGFPLLAAGAPYPDYVAWADDVSARRERGELTPYQELPLARRLLQRALANLASGVTAVGHMNPYVRRVFHRREFPVRVLGDGRLFHSLHFGGDLAPFLAKVKGRRFMVHACEGTSERARVEIDALAAAGALTPRTIVVHGTALDAPGAALLARSGATLVICPCSNRTLYGAAPDVAMLRDARVPLALGSDSSISGPADLLADMEAARTLGMPEDALWAAVSEVPARAFGRPDLGVLQDGSPADLVMAPAADPDLRAGRASVVLVMKDGVPLLSRRAGLLAELGVAEAKAAGGIFLEPRLARWCEKLGCHL